VKVGKTRKLVAAHTGPYPDGTIRPIEELEAAVKRRRHVPLTLGHPPSINGVPGPIPEHLLLGDVEYQIDRERGIEIANTTFFDEYFDRLPEHIRQKVVNLEPVPISQGFEHGWREPNVLSDIMPHHLAVLLDEKPLCPLDKCGVEVAVRAESGLQFRYEQRAEATEEALDMSEQPKPDPIEGIRKEIAELRELFIESLKPKEQPAQEAPVAVAREEPVKQEAEAPQRPPPETVRAPVGEPVRSIPASVPSAGDGLERDPITGGIIQRMVKKHDRS
jgi:hypothetical protein